MVALVLALAACSSPESTAPAPTTAAPPGSAAPTTTVPPTSTVGPTTTIAPTTTTTVPPLEGLAWEEVVDLGGFVTGIEPLADGFLATTKDGRIHAVVDGEATVLADLSGLVRDSGEQGLLDLALHPDGDRLFIHYSADDGDTVLAELAYPALDATTTLFRTGQPAGNHNGGSVEFGPDGMLYLALGDGGGAGDPYGNGQRSDTPLAAIHRFDVSVPGEAVAPVDNPGFEVPTIWLYGVRNPWRIAFGPADESGTDTLLIVADVGQRAWEEITFLPATEPGQNLGWPIQEGRHCYAVTPCDDPGIRMAQAEVGHGDGGTCSITGGEVYVGAAIPELRGHYVFSDFCGEYVRSVDVWSGIGEPADVVDWAAPALVGPAVLAAGADGELLAGGADGRVRRLVPVR